MLPEQLTDPLPLALLTLALLAALQYQRSMGWREYTKWHALKVRFLPLVDRYTTAFVVSDKAAPEDDAEHIATVDGTVRDVWQRLVDAGGSPHLINSIKRLPNGNLSAAHVVWVHDDGSQTEAYLFRAVGVPDPNAVHVYAHSETAFTDPRGHLGDGQRDGDPKGVVRSGLNHRTQHEQALETARYFNPEYDT